MYTYYIVVIQRKLCAGWWTLPDKEWYCAVCAKGPGAATRQIGKLLSPCIPNSQRNWRPKRPDKEIQATVASSKFEGQIFLNLASPFDWNCLGVKFLFLRLALLQALPRCMSSYPPRVVLGSIGNLSAKMTLFSWESKGTPLRAPTPSRNKPLFRDY